MDHEDILVFVQLYFNPGTCRSFRTFIREQEPCWSLEISMVHKNNNERKPLRRTIHDPVYCSYQLIDKGYYTSVGTFMVKFTVIRSLIPVCPTDLSERPSLTWGQGKICIGLHSLYQWFNPQKTRKVRFLFLFLLFSFFPYPNILKPWKVFLKTLNLYYKL